MAKVRRDGESNWLVLTVGGEEIRVRESDAKLLLAELSKWQFYEPAPAESYSERCSGCRGFGCLFCGGTGKILRFPGG